MAPPKPKKSGMLRTRTPHIIRRVSEFNQSDGVLCLSIVISSLCVKLHMTAGGTCKVHE